MGSLIVLSAVTPASAATWDYPGTGSWSGNNWYQSGTYARVLPNAFEGAYISNGGTAVIDAGQAAVTDQMSIGMVGRTGVSTQSGIGNLTITGGSLTVGPYDSSIGDYGLAPGNQMPGIGTVTMSGGTWTNARHLYIGHSGVGTFNLTGGTVSSPLSTIGFDGTGTATVTGGIWTNSGELMLGNLAGSRGTLNQSGGIIRASFVRTGYTTGCLGTINIGAGGSTTGILDTDYITNKSENVLPGVGVVTFNHTSPNHFFTRNGTSTGAGIQINGNISVNKRGSGTTTLTDAHYYTGPTIIEAGVLAFVEGQCLSPITVNDGAAAGFSLGFPFFSSNTLAFSATGNSKVKISGVPSLLAYRLFTTSKVGGITGIPLLDPPIPGYKLLIEKSGTTLNLVSSYALWASASGLTGTVGSTTDSTLTADPDKDGATNLAEFAFNGNPLSGVNNGQIYGLTADTSADSETALKELVLTLAVRKSTAAFTAGAPSTATSVYDGITYSIEGSSSLSGFALTVTPVTLVDPGVPITGPQAADYEYRSFSLSGSNGLPQKGFLRAKVTIP